MDRVGFVNISHDRQCSDCETGCGLYTIGKITSTGTFSDVKLAGSVSEPIGKYLLKVQDISPGKIEPNTQQDIKKVYENEISILKKINIGPKMFKYWTCKKEGKVYGYILLENWCYGYTSKNCGDLLKFKKALTGDGWKPDLAIQWIKRVLKEYKKLHDAGIAHIDNHERNILYRRKKDGEPAEITIIDFGLSKDFTNMSDAERADLIFLDLAGITKMFQVFGITVSSDRSKMTIADEDLSNLFKEHMSRYMKTNKGKFEVNEVFTQAFSNRKPITREALARAFAYTALPLSEEVLTSRQKSSSFF